MNKTSIPELEESERWLREDYKSPSIVGVHRERLSAELDRLRASVKRLEAENARWRTAPPQEPSERATRAVWWACKDLDEAVKWTRQWPGPAHGFDSPEYAAALIASHPKHKDDQVFQIQITVTAQRTNKEGK